MAVDLPGAYSMSPFTSEESITSSYVKNEQPDAIVNIVDATNLSRSLFFTTQLLELGVPVVVALNKSDITEKKQTKIDEKRLVRETGLPCDQDYLYFFRAYRAKGSGRSSGLVKGRRPESALMYRQISTCTDKEAVEAADRKRFDFVNGIVKEVETEKSIYKR